MTANQMHQLSELLPHDKYIRFCENLGVEFNIADRILAKYNNDYKQATRKVLADWKTKTGGKLVDMMKCMKLTEVGGLCDQL